MDDKTFAFICFLAYNDVSSYNVTEYIGRELTRDDLCQYIVKDKSAAYKCITTHSSKINAKNKKLLLNAFIDDHELFIKYLRVNSSKITYEEYKVIIPYILENNIELFDYIRGNYIFKRDNIKRLKLKKCYFEKLESLKMMYTLTEN